VNCGPSSDDNAITYGRERTDSDVGWQLAISPDGGKLGNARRNERLPVEQFEEPGKRGFRVIDLEERDSGRLDACGDNYGGGGAAIQLTKVATVGRQGEITGTSRVKRKQSLNLQVFVSADSTAHQFSQCLQLVHAAEFNTPAEDTETTYQRVSVSSVVSVADVVTSWAA